MEQSSVNVPTKQDYARYCNDIVAGDVTLYNQYWDLSVCGKLTDAASLGLVREALLKLWRQKYADIHSTCNCVNVDIFQNLVQYYTSGYYFLDFYNQI